MQKVILAFDLGGTNLKYGLGTSKGQIVFNSQVKSGGSGDLEGVTRAFMQAAAEMKDYASGKGMRIVAVGLGTPGAVDKTTGSIMGSSPNIPSIVGISLRDFLEKEIGVPVTIDNDGNFATLGEALCGAGKGYHSVVGLTLGTGIGGGFVIDGEIYRGDHGCAMELGHTIVDYDGRICGCGKKGCIEAYASGTALIKRANMLGDREFEKSRPLFEAANAGYEPAITAIEEGVDALSSAVASFINSLDPGCVVIGGGVMFGYKMYWSEMEEMVSLKVVDAAIGKTPILPAELGNDAGIVGACIAAGKDL